MAWGRKLNFPASQDSPLKWEWVAGVPPRGIMRMQQEIMDMEVLWKLWQAYISIVISLTRWPSRDSVQPSLVKEEQLCHQDYSSSPSTSFPALPLPSMVYSPHSSQRDSGKQNSIYIMLKAFRRHPSHTTCKIERGLQGPAPPCPYLLPPLPTLLAPLLVPRWLRCPPASACVHWTGFPWIAAMGHLHFLRSLSKCPFIGQFFLLHPVWTSIPIYFQHLLSPWGTIYLFIHLCICCPHSGV